MNSAAARHDRVVMPRARDPVVELVAEPAVETHYISLPGIHCAGCIARVEAALADIQGLHTARVNLSRKQVRVTAQPGTGAGPALSALQAAGYEAHELDHDALVPGKDRQARVLLNRIAVAGFAMMNVMVLSVAVWAGAGDATRLFFNWIAAAIALPALAYSAVPFFTSAFGALRRGRVNMDVPIALAIALAGLMSLYGTVYETGADAWFEAALSLTFFLLVGRYLDHRARASARSAAAELAALELPRATRLIDGTHESISVSDIGVGDRIALAAGARAPVDGLSECAGLIDRSALTGEATPIPISAGDPVCAGEVAIDIPLTLQATARAEDSTLRRLAALVEVAETGRHRYSGLADRAAQIYAPVVHLLAALTFAGWWLATGDLYLAIGTATAVLIITCPCALGLAVPMVTASFTGRLFRAGLLLKSRTALERLARIDCVLLDKTGTLTEGQAGLVPLDDDAAGVALSLANASGHPVSRSIAAALAHRVPAKLTRLKEHPGKGIGGFWRGKEVFLGRVDGRLALQIANQVIPLGTKEHLRKNARAMVKALMRQGFDVHLVTGDHHSHARALAQQIGIEQVHANHRPEDKAELVDRLSSGGRHVLMVGDGLNDTAAMARADASIAPASALDAARVAADGVLLSPDLAEIAAALSAAKRAVRRIRQNFALAIVYNVIAVPLAVSGLATPLIAAIAMSGSSISVVLNSVRR